MSAASITIDGVGPMQIVRPTAVAELGEIVRAAARDGTPLYPVGGGTHLHLGSPPERTGLAVECRALDQVIDYPARDMTITVQAGISISRLASTLATENQWLPLDVASAEQATLGGVLAANISGPRRLGYGTARDYVIGISAVNDDGNEFKAGGRVVKNVAGYDLCKLLVGSLGTLGIITQVTLKLRPRPEASRLATIAVEDDQLAEALDRIHGSRTRPVAVEVVDNKLASGMAGVQAGVPWLIVVGFEGNREAVDWQVRQLQEEWSQRAEAVNEGTTSAVWKHLLEPVSPEADAFVMKASLLSSRVGDFCRVQKSSGGVLIHAHAASGVVLGHGQAGLTLEQASAMLKRWRNAAQDAQGKVVLTRCPPEWKRTLSVWGPDPDHAWLLREVKKQMDPRRVFNPGRFVSGI